MRCPGRTKLYKNTQIQKFAMRVFKLFAIRGENSQARKPWLFAMVFLLLVLFEQLVKAGVSRVFHNDKFAFSLPVPAMWMYALYAVILVGLAWYVIKHHRYFGAREWLGLTLIFAGAASNIGERLVLGYVRDYIYLTAFSWTGIYNLADGYIIAGIFLLISTSKKLE